MDERWYYVGANRSPVGPHSREALEALRASGRLAGDTLVWKEGTNGWAPYSASGLKAPSPPPIPPPVPSNPDPKAVDFTGAPNPETALNSAPPLGSGIYSVARASSPVPIESATLRTPQDGDEDSGNAEPSTSAPEPPTQPVDDDGWQCTQASPWRRYFARMLDTVLLGTLIWIVLAVVFAAMSNDLYRVFFGSPGLATNRISATILTLAVVAPVEALILGLTGTTIGKWVFGIRVTDAAGRSIGLVQAGLREAAVFLKGLGLGIPIVSLITMIAGYRMLKHDGATSWDYERPWVVTYRPAGAAQTILFVLGVLVFVTALIILQALDQTKV